MRACSSAHLKPAGPARAEARYWARAGPATCAGPRENGARESGARAAGTEAQRQAPGRKVPRRLPACCSRCRSATRATDSNHRPAKIARVHRTAAGGPGPCNFWRAVVCADPRTVGGR